MSAKNIAEQHQVQAGLFLTVALILLGVAIFLLGSERKIFGRQEEFTSSFGNVQGLSEGAPVLLGGLKVGRVNKVTFSQNPRDQQVYVEFLVDEEYLDRVRRDTTVSIQTQGLLGDKLLSLSVGSSNEILPPGGDIPTKSEGDITAILDQASKIASTSVEIADGLDEFLEDIRTNTLKDANRAFASIADIADAIRDGDGAVHQVIYGKSNKFTAMEDFNKVAKNISTISEEIVNGKGILHSLIYGKDGENLVSALAAAATNLGETSETLGTLMSEIEQGDNTLHALIYGEAPEGLEHIMKKLSTSATNIEKLTKGINEGSGTIGALLLDSSVYDNLVEITDGAKRSFLLREAIRSALSREE